MAQSLGTVNLHGEYFTLYLLDHTDHDGEWVGFYEVRDGQGLVMATAMTEKMAVKSALTELEYQKCEIEDALTGILGNTDDAA